jgi:hypothetical protein
MQGLGALAKGFSDGAGKAFSCQQHPAATGILKRLLEINISVLEVLRDVEAIREGVRCKQMCDRYSSPQ